jgi:hypothetical protein
MVVHLHYSASIDGIMKLQILTGRKILKSFFLKNGDSLTGKLSGDNFFKILNSRWHCALIGNSAAL